MENNFPVPAPAKKRGRPALGWLAGLLVLLCLPAAPVLATTCANAIVIPTASLPIVGQAITCGAGNDLNSTNVPGPLCGTNDFDAYKNGTEALYSFTPATTGTYQLTLEGQNWNSAMVYIGCPTANNCLYGDGTSGSTVSFAVTLVAGTTYYIWFDTWPSPNSPCPGTFSLGPPPPPATNDNPCGAINLPVNASCTYASGTTAGTSATTGVPAPTCANYNGGDVWYRITVPPTGAVTITTGAGVITDGGMALYTATACNGTFSQIACNDDANGLMPEIMASGLTPGGTVYIRFWEYGNDNPGSFSICATTFIPPVPPVCGAMFYDPGGASGNYANNTNYTVTICPMIPGDMVSLAFSLFNTEFIDGLSIYDGTNTAAPLLGTFSGTTLPPCCWRAIPPAASPRSSSPTARWSGPAGPRRSAASPRRRAIASMSCGCMTAPGTVGAAPSCASASTAVHGPTTPSPPRATWY